LRCIAEVHSPFFFVTPLFSLLLRADLDLSLWLSSHMIFCANSLPSAQEMVRCSFLPVPWPEVRTCFFFCRLTKTSFFFCVSFSLPLGGCKTLWESSSGSGTGCGPSIPLGLWEVYPIYRSSCFSPSFNCFWGCPPSPFHPETTVMFSSAKTMPAPPVLFRAYFWWRSPSDHPEFFSGHKVMSFVLRPRTSLRFMGKVTLSSSDLPSHFLSSGFNSFSFSVFRCPHWISVEFDWQCVCAPSPAQTLMVFARDAACHLSSLRLLLLVLTLRAFPPR